MEIPSAIFRGSRNRELACGLCLISTRTFIPEAMSVPMYIVPLRYGGVCAACYMVVQSAANAIEDGLLVFSGNWRLAGLVCFFMLIVSARWMQTH